MAVKEKKSGFKDQTNEKRKEESNKRKYNDYGDERDNYKMDKHFEKDCREWHSKMNSDEYDAVQTYTGSTYEQMNEYLREDKYGTDESPYLETIIKNASNGINKFVLKENVYVYRQSTADLFAQANIFFKPYGDTNNDKNEFIARLNAAKGTIVTDKGFTSTSTQKDMWGGHVYYEIRVPKGTNCAYVNDISRNSGEKEIILNRGTQYKIVGARMDGTNPTVVLQVVKPSGRKKK